MCRLLGLNSPTDSTHPEYQRFNECCSCKVVQQHACAGDGANVYFRSIDQSDPAMQAKMLQALDVVYDAEYVSRELSPTIHWLESFQAFVAQSQPANVTADGSVAQAAFYDSLELFLTQQVCKPGAYTANHSLGAVPKRSVIEILLPMNRIGHVS
jgi:hypothetical protein